MPTKTSAKSFNFLFSRMQQQLLSVLCLFLQLRWEKNMTAYCDLWNGTFTGMFHAANSVIGIGFAVPQSFDYGLLTLKFLVCLGLFMLLFWASELICFAPDFFFWNSCFLIINFCYVLALIKKHFPTFLPKYLEDHYELVFKPFMITKKVRN